MRIAIVGYGKMGKLIEELALEKGHSISFRISSTNAADIHKVTPSNTDVCIEFSVPGKALENLITLIKNNNKVVCGTTGWLEHYEELTTLAQEQKGAFLYASNFSVGVNIFFAINQKLASLMADQPDYTAMVEEIHHTSKKDAPSGTGLTLTQQILAIHPSYDQWVNHTRERPKSALPLISKRIDPAPGTHIITYDSPIDSIEIKHTAHSRKGFALGAIAAAAYIVDKQGVFTMNDVLKI
jgi:4-hydroxy-tetrahydrodipicolinate reductase